MTENLFPNDPKIPDIVELKNVSQSYDEGKSWIIKDFNMLIEGQKDSNQFISILGGSGCGKSTILRYIAGIQKPTSGEILIREKPRTKKDICGFIFQQYSSFPWRTVLDNVAFGLELQGMSQKERYEKSMEMIKLVGLEGQEHKFAKYPTLSGGQLQRVAFARSLVVNPSVLLLDEPMGALDINTRNKMQDLINDIWAKLKGITFILVTHDISEAVYLGDEIWIMAAKPGRIVDRVFIDLPVERNRALKRTNKFIEIVRSLEDKMDKVSALKVENK